MAQWILDFIVKVAADVSLTVAGSIIAALGILVPKKIRRLPLQVLLERSRLGSAKEPTAIVLPHFPSPETRVKGMIEGLPSNVNLVGVLDSLAAFDIHRAVELCGKMHRTRMFAHDQLPPLQQSFISVGGRSVNSLTAQSVFTPYVEYPAHRAKVSHSTYDATIENSVLVVDYGFIIVTANPWNSERRCCLVYGLYPQGTWAAAHAFCNPLKSGLLQQLLRTNSKTLLIMRLILDNWGLRKIKRLDNNFVVVVKTIVSDRALLPGLPQIVQVEGP